MKKESFSLVEITEVRDFDNLHDVWNCLAYRHETYRPFLCHEWFKLWLEHFLGDSRLRIFLLYEQDTLKMIAPFLLKREKLKGVSVNRLELIGNVYSPIRYFLFSDTSLEARQKQVRRLVVTLRDRCGMWDVMDLYGLPEENSSFDVLRESVKDDGLQLSEYSCYGNYYLDAIDFGSKEYFSRLPRRITKDIEYCQRRLQKDGEYEFRMVMKPTDADQHMKIYYDVYSKSWQEREAIGPSFHQDLARVAAEKSWLRLGLLFFERKAIAAQFWLTCEGTSYIMKTVYDRNYRKFSPGKVLTGEMMKYALDSDNIKEVDYLHGDDQYKEAWTPKRRERKGLLVFSENLKGRYFSFLYNNLRPIVRQSAFLSKLRNVTRTV